MKNKSAILLALLGSMVTSQAIARDSINTYPVESLLASSKAKEALLSDVSLYFGTQTYPKPIEQYGEVMTNKKTNAFMKSDREACEWVMLSALKALQERAKREGMNAVTNIQSFYKKREFVSESEYECGAGNIMAGVTLKGTLIKVDS
ncbi:excinuclease ABC subunit A [Flocculibacter collagenilyticus]|uniref:excinuclease ABC subunit A n=1 Tax=Flocculibacter collagenilyticus TaxID=2744479 RepID=UPI0018F2EA8D|nr:excinuclease ABC subunit A [Flocculibacter collagenilyticus]